MDIRGTSYAPNQLQSDTATFNFANSREIGLPIDEYCILINIKPWHDETAATIQIAITMGNLALYIRNGSNTSWGNWVEK